MSSFSNRRIFSSLGAVALIGAAVGLTVTSNAALETQDDGESDIRVGTFQPQTAFESYHGADDMNQKMQELQMQMQEAQQQGDQQRMMELQTQMQQMQNEVIEKFYDDLEKAMPGVAEETDVKIVAVDVVYTDPEIGDAEDITSKVVEHLNGDRENEQDDAPAEDSTAPW